MFKNNHGQRIRGVKKKKNLTFITKALDVHLWSFYFFMILKKKKKKKIGYGPIIPMSKIQVEAELIKQRNLS